MPSQLVTERHGNTLVLVIRGDDPTNILSGQVCTAGVEALNVAWSDDDIHAVVLRGAGSHFSSGLAPESSSDRDAADAVNQFIDTLQTCPRPVIAAVEGMAIGAGLGLALGCDLIVAADDARFSIDVTTSSATSSLSVDDAGVPPIATLASLTARLPRQTVMQMSWFPETALSATRLQALGIVNEVSASGTAFDAALRWSVRLSSLAPDLLAGAKERLQRLG